MHDEIKYLLIENESEFKSDLLKKIENIDELDELLEYLDELISYQYYKGLFIDSDEYDKILSENINRIIENYYESEYENKSEYYNNKEMLKIQYDSDESEYKYYIFKLLDAYDIFLSGIKFKTEITDKIKIESIYLIDLYSENDSLEMPEYLNELTIYESESDYYESIDELILCHLAYNLNDSYSDKISKNSMIFNYFNYNEYKSDEIDNNEIFEYSGLLLESENDSKFIQYAYIKDYNRIY